MDNSILKELNSYQIKILQDEISFLLKNEESLAFKIYNSALFRLLTSELQKLYWTITRIVGLSHLHDGSRRIVLPAVMPERACQPACCRPLLNNPRVLIDATPTYLSGRHTGIQRVVREISEAALRMGAGLPIVVLPDGIKPLFRNPEGDDRIDIQDGDRLLMIDSNWEQPDRQSALMNEVSRRNGKNILGIHDLIPLTYPGLCDPSFVSVFETWLSSIVAKADAVVTVSDSVASDLRQYMTMSEALRQKPLPIRSFHLGCDFSASGAQPAQTVLIAAASGRYCLSVGTLEPRKGHSIALDAFEKLWASGIDIRYVIVGSPGRNMLALSARIRHHREFGRRLIWLTAVTDADLQHLYAHAAGLVFPSLAEGFGLPLIEASRFGIPAVVTDIPIFREIGLTNTTYFAMLDSHQLAKRIADMIGTKPHPAETPQTWQQATEDVLNLVRDFQF